MTGAPVPVERTWAVGDIATAAILNANLRDAVNFLLNPPIARLTQTTAQTISNATLTRVLFDTTIYDTYSGHSNTVNPSQYVAQVAGYYRIQGTISWAASGTGARLTQVVINGASQVDTQGIYPASAGNGSVVNSAAAICYMNAGDYAEIYCEQTTGSNLATSGSGTSGMTVEWLHA